MHFRVRSAMSRTHCRPACCPNSGCPETGYPAAWMGMQEWPSAAWHASLSILDVAGNAISGAVPACLFGAGIVLSELALGSNDLTGTIPNVHAANLSRLQLLDVSSNRLTGAVPGFLGRDRLPHHLLKGVKLEGNALRCPTQPAIPYSDDGGCGLDSTRRRPSIITLVFRNDPVSTLGVGKLVLIVLGMAAVVGMWRWLVGSWRSMARFQSHSHGH